MIPCSIWKVGALAAFSTLLLLLLFLAGFARRVCRRLRLLEAAARRAYAERVAVPEPLADEAPPPLTLPRFIGSPHSTYRAP